MRKLFMTVVCAAFAVFVLQTAANAATFTMTYSFKIFGNPSARQVALNLADKQASLAKGEESELDLFVEGLKRRLMSQVYREIIEDIFNPDGPPHEGNYYAGNLIINVRTDEEGNTVIIVEDTVTGEVSIIDLSDFWGSGLPF